MADSACELDVKPPRSALVRGLSEIFAARIAEDGPLRIVSRRANPRASTYAADIVHVEFAAGVRQELLCKYSRPGQLAQPTPHRGLEYEAAVYRQVLTPAPLTLPEFFGSFRDPDSGLFVFVMRFYRGAISAAQACEHGGLSAVMRWMAELHHWGEQDPVPAAWSILTRLDADAYEQWAERTLMLARPLAQEFPWLARATAAYRERIPFLVQQPLTLVHGECTPLNSLWADGQVLIIDWETAALGPAAIDLATFTYDWDRADLEHLEQDYAARRWPAGPPAEWAESLLAARLYVSFHWLFGSMQGITAERVRCHLEDLYREVERWNLLSTIG